MSSDNAMFIQECNDGSWSAQVGTMNADTPPNPEDVPFEKRYPDIQSAILANIEYSEETEYGFRFPTLSGNGFGPTQTHNDDSDEALFGRFDMGIALRSARESYQGVVGSYPIEWMPLSGTLDVRA